MMLLASKPMLQYTIEAAVNSGIFDKVCVSSDSSDVAELADSLGAKYWHRLEGYSGSEISVYEVCHMHLTIELACNRSYDAFAVLLPTSPLRTAEDIQDAYKRFSESNAAECLMSVSKFEYQPEWSLTEAKGSLKPSEPVRYKTKRQNLPQHYKHDGLIIMCKTETFLSASDWIDMNPIPWYTPPERVLDVDTLEDFRYAEWVLSGVKMNAEK